MTSYDTMRHFADMWGLLTMFAFFLAAAVFAFRPGSRAHYEKVARIPLEKGSED